MGMALRLQGHDVRVAARGVGPDDRPVRPHDHVVVREAIGGIELLLGLAHGARSVDVQSYQEPVAHSAPASVVTSLDADGEKSRR